MYHEEPYKMKRREILGLLAGCVLMLAPMQARADELSDVLSEASVDVLSFGKDTADGADSISDTDTGSVSENRDSSVSADEAELPDDAGDQEEQTEDGAGSADERSDVLNPIGAGVILETTKTEREYAEAYEKAKNANWGYTNLGIANVDNNLNIRAIAAEDGRLVGKLPKNAACEVLDDDGTWAHIKSGKVEGYVSMDYLLTGISAKRKAEELAVTMARVTTDSLKVRAEASTDSEVITLVPNGEELEVISVEGDWVRVYLDDEEVYVHADYVEVSSELGTAITMTELLYGQGVSDIRVDICQYA